MLTCMYTAAKNMARSSGAYGCSQTEVSWDLCVFSSIELRLGMQDQTKMEI